LPAQCPACGRFLKRELVASLAEGPASCPRCGEDLDQTAFDAARPTAEPSTAPASQPRDVVTTELRTPSTEPTGSAGSAGDRDPLDGWDREPPPSAGRDEVVVALAPQELAMAAGLGLLLGALVGGRHRLRGGILGAVAGILAAALVQAANQFRGGATR